MEIVRCRETPEPGRVFGVNLTFLPSVPPPDYPGDVRTIVDRGIEVVETAGNNPARWAAPAEAAG